MALLLPNPELADRFLGIAFCAAAIAGIGLADDVWDIASIGASWPARLAVASCGSVRFGVQIKVVSNPFGGAIELDATVAGSSGFQPYSGLVGMMNAINLLDGLDGLAPGVVLVAALLILAVLVGEFGKLALGRVWTWSLAGSIAGFLPFNAYKAKLILGRFRV